MDGSSFYTAIVDSPAKKQHRQTKRKRAYHKEPTNIVHKVARIGQNSRDIQSELAYQIQEVNKLNDIQIFVDKREKEEIKTLFESCTRVVFQTMYVGDVFVVYKNKLRLAIERKSLGDLNGRLGTPEGKNQRERLYKTLVLNHIRTFLLVDCSKSVNIRWKGWDAIFGSTINGLQDYGLNILYLPTIHHTLFFIMKLARKLGAGELYSGHLPYEPLLGENKYEEFILQHYQEEKKEKITLETFDAIPIHENQSLLTTVNHTAKSREDGKLTSPIRIQKSIRKNKRTKPTKSSNEEKQQSEIIKQEDKKADISQLQQLHETAKKSATTQAEGFKKRLSTIDGVGKRIASALANHFEKDRILYELIAQNREDAIDQIASIQLNNKSVGYVIANKIVEAFS
jgi:ERCC4-type nuclease